MNLNKHLIIYWITDFKVWWPQDPAVCGSGLGLGVKGEVFQRLHKELVG